MPLQKTLVTIPIAGGLDEGTDPRLSATMSKLSNGMYAKTGALDKRFGTAKVGTYTASSIKPFPQAPSDAPPPAVCMGTRGQELTRVGQGAVHTWSQPAPLGAGAWCYAAPTSSVTLTRSVPFVTTPSEASYCDIAFANGFTVYAISFGQHVFLSAYDGQGTCVVYNLDAGYSPATGGFFGMPKLVGFGNYVYVSVVDSNAQLFLSRFNTTTLAIDIVHTSYSGVTLTGASQGGTIEAEYVPNFPYDFVALDTCLAVAGYASNNTVIYYFDYSLNYIKTLQTPTLLTALCSFCIAPHLDGSSNSLFVVYAGTQVSLAQSAIAFIHASGTAITTPETVLVGTNTAVNVTAVVSLTGFVGTASSIACAVFADDLHITGLAQGSQTQTFHWGLLSTSAVTYVNMRTINILDGIEYAYSVVDAYMLSLNSRAIVHNRTPYVALRQTGFTNTAVGAGGLAGILDTQCTLFFAAIDIGQTASLFPVRVVGTSAPRQLAPVLPGGFNGFCSTGICKTGTNSYALVASQTPITVNTHSSEITNFAIVFDGPIDTRSLNSTFYLAGGAPSYFDGQTNSEIGFFAYPYNVQVTSSGGGPLSGTYSYVAVYAWENAQGVTERSAPSTPVTVTLSASGATITVPNPPMTNKLGFAGFGTAGVNIEIYRTIASGSIYYLLEACVVATTLTSPQITTTDSTPDATLQECPQLYTTGNVLDNVNPPSASYVHTIAQEIWLLGTDDDTIWYSPGVVGNQAPIWNEGFTIQPFAGGPCVAMSDMDGTRYIFKSDTIWSISGAVPNDQGLNGSISQPQRVCISDGCIEPRSVLATAEGIYFQSRRGICRLTRASNVEFIGNPVSLELAGYVITSAVLDSVNSQVLFGCLSTSDNSSGKILAFNYRIPPSYIATSANSQQGWSVNTYRATNASTPTNYGPTAMTIYNGRMTYCDARGQVETEDPTTYLDEGNLWVTMSFVAPESHALGISGYQLIYRAGILQRRDTPHGFSLSFAYDYNPTYEQVITYTDTQATGMALEEVQIHLARKCRSLRLAYTDIAPTVGAVGTGKGPSITGITLELGSKGTLARTLPTGQT